MLRKIMIWVVALVLTLGSAYYQRKTGPSYPIEGKSEFAGTKISYSLGRSNRGLGKQLVTIVAPDPKIMGRVKYKRYKTDDSWTEVLMQRQSDRLIAWLPEQPPAGKLEYYVELMTYANNLRIPSAESIVTRHTGKVPDLILYPHIFFMFLAMLFAFRAGLETFFSDCRVRSLTFWALGTLFIGGFILGMLVQHFAFGPYWTGVPFGWDMTDNKTLIAFLAWMVAVFAVWNKGKLMHQPGRKWFVLGAVIVMMLAYLIPHSVLGSELDYQKENADKPATVLPR
jgi:hypothetical protein